jgi:hypothetical protein
MRTRHSRSTLRFRRQSLSFALAAETIRELYCCTVAESPNAVGHSYGSAKAMSRLCNNLIFFVLILAVGCFMTREPTTAEAVGTYDLTEVYIDMVETGLSEKIRNSEAKSSILLYADGTSSLVNFPFFEEGAKTFEYRFKRFQSIDARWTITSVGSVSSGGNDSKTVYGIEFTLTDSRKLFDC